MATHRPGFTRKDTDQVTEPGTSSTTYELQDFDEKKTADATELPAYKDDHHDNFVNEDELTKGVETATDLVTKVLHVEDDPTMKVWTFRTIFLGMCCTAGERSVDSSLEAC